MRLALPLAAFALLAIPAAAQTAPPATSAAAQATPAAAEAVHHKRHYLSLDKRFEMANTTHDGRLTQDQAHSAKVMHVVSENFTAIDKDHKGYVTEDDIRAWYKARRAERRREKEAAAAKS